MKQSKKKETLPNMEFVTKLAAAIADYVHSKSHGNKLNPNYPKWYAGITFNPKIREVGHKTKRNVSELVNFNSWYAYTYANARAVEKLLCSIYGMSNCKSEGNTNKDDNPKPSNRVYVYDIPKTEKKSK